MFFSLLCEGLAQNGGKMDMSSLFSMPEVVNAKKGTVASAEKFISKYPETFSLTEEVNPTNPEKSKKCITLLRQVGQKRPFATTVVTVADNPQVNPELARRQFVRLLIGFLESVPGNEISTEALANTDGISQAKKGVVAKWKPFFEKYPEVFEPSEQLGEEGKPPIATVRLQPTASDWAAANSCDEDVLAGPVLPVQKKMKVKAENEVALSPEEAEWQRLQLLAHVEELLSQAAEGSLRVEDIANEPQTMELRKGLKDKLTAFLDKQEQFQVFDAEAENGRICKCVALSV